MARERADRAEILRTLGATVRARAATPAADLEQEPGVDLVVVGESPGLDRPYAEEAAARGIEVLADVELAWRLLPVRAEWLVVGGSARRRATADLAAAMAVAAGVRAAAAGGLVAGCA
ncbi:MAG: hypothetical protein U0Q15_13085 [Kineosporiaceae bacterium]